MSKKNNKVLVIGDLHAPFTHKSYLNHCKKIYKKHKCNKVVFIGDIIDGHYSSFHQADPDGLGGMDELYTAKKQIKEWYKAFPEAVVILGNHDRIVTRKAKMASLPSAWIRSFGEVLEVPNWEWKVQEFIDDVLYVHGESGTARTMVKNHGCSVVQGHRHSEAYVEYLNGPLGTRFGAQVGCGVDRDSYAMDYAKAYKWQVLSCLVVEGGKTAIIEPLLQ